MCIKCRLLGTVANIADDGKEIEDIGIFHEIGCLDAPNIDIDSDKIDKRAQLFLRETLEQFYRNGIDLVPLITTSDGSCLPHAISKALFGTETLFDLLRHGLYNELKDNEEWYFVNTDIGRTSFNREAWTVSFKKILSEAAPTRGAKVGRDKFLGDIHILGLANLLGRPILLLDEFSKMVDPGTEGHGLFPPLRRTRQEIISLYGFVPGVIAIAYASSSRDHFVALANNSFSKMIADNKDNLFEDSDYWKILPKLMKDKCMYYANSSEEEKKNKEALYKELSVLVEFCHYNPPGVVLHSAKILFKILDNIDKYADGQPSVDIKCLKFSLNTSNMKFNVCNVIGAEKILEYCGFSKVKSEEESISTVLSNAIITNDSKVPIGGGSASAVSKEASSTIQLANSDPAEFFMEFGAKSKDQIRLFKIDRRIAFKEVLRYLSDLNIASNGKPNCFNGLSDIFKDEESEKSCENSRLDTLFGKPSIFHNFEEGSPRTVFKRNQFEWFTSMVEIYGTGSVKTGSSWSLGNRLNIKQYKEIVTKLMNTWETRFNRLVCPRLPPGNETLIDVFKKMNSYEALKIVCPECKCSYYWCERSLLEGSDMDPYDFMAFYETVVPSLPCNTPGCSNTLLPADTFCLTVYQRLRDIFAASSKK